MVIKKDAFEDYYKQEIESTYKDIDTVIVKNNKEAGDLSSFKFIIYSDFIQNNSEKINKVSGVIYKKEIQPQNGAGKPVYSISIGERYLELNCCFEVAKKFLDLFFNS